VRTLALTIRVPDQHHEFLIAELADLDFNAFEEYEDRLIAYAPADRWNDVSRERIEGWLRIHDLPVEIDEEVAPDVNWNARWEASIEPIPVGRFLIKPSWHEVAPELADRVVLEVDPKMSFGTGYHPSTRLVLRFLPGIVRGGERVLDAGCGTGILAIAALKLGAESAIGFDIDPWASVNAGENAERNGLAERLDVREGSLEVVPESGFNLILANINRNALLAMLPELADRLVPGGPLVLAGLLREDREDVVEAAGHHGLELHDEATENEWWSGVFSVSVW
jgi:ribosomal protein L11 methyltransferase